MNEESIVIDPVGMNIVNRVARGTKLEGTLTFEGGLLVQGEIIGIVKITGGPLVLMQEGVMAGDISCDQDAYLFGQIHHKPNGEDSELTSGGAAFLAETLVANANITAANLRTYDGMSVNGRIRTHRNAADGEAGAK